MITFLCAVLGIVLGIVLAILMWVLFPFLALTPFVIFMSTPFSLFIARVTAVVGVFAFGFYFPFLLKDELFRAKEYEKKVESAGIVVFDSAGGGLKSVPAKDGDPQRDLFYFDTPILGFNLGMTIPELKALMGENKKALKIEDYVYAPHLGGISFRPPRTTSLPFQRGCKRDDKEPGLLDVGLCYKITDMTKCPVPIKGLERIALLFVGGRLVQIEFMGIRGSPRDAGSEIGREAEALVKEAIIAKYEITRKTEKDLTFLIGDKECLLLERSIVNLPYLRAIYDVFQKEIQQDKQNKQNDVESARQRVMDNI